MMQFWALTVDNLKEFYNRCIMKEAITREERMAILNDLLQEKKVLETGTINGKLGEALEKYFEDTNHKGVIGLKKKDEHNNIC